MNGTAERLPLARRRRTRLATRLSGPLLRVSVSTGSTYARFGMITVILLMAWIGVYGDLLGRQLTAQACSPSQSGQLCSARLAFFAAVTVAGLLVIESGMILVWGTIMYGRIFVLQKVFMIGFATTCTIFIALLMAGFSERYASLVYAVPICAACRLLLSPVIRAERKQFSKVVEMAHGSRLNLDVIAKAINEAKELTKNDRSTLLRLAQAQDATSPWDASAVRRFLREADAELAQRSSAAGTAALLYGVVDRIGKDVGTSSNFNYGIFATLTSGTSYLMQSTPANCVLFVVACLGDGCMGPLQAWLISLLTNSIIDQDQQSASWQIAAYIGSQLLNLVCYVALVRSFAGLLAKGTAHVQKRVALQMLSMGSQDSTCYPDGFVNATFASDVLRLQDLWTGLTWSLASPLTRVLVTITYAFYVTPQVGVLALSVFPIIFITVPQGQSSTVAALHSVSTAETIDIFQNGVSCQRMLWQCDKQNQWFRTVLLPLITDQEQKHMRMRLLGGAVQGYVQQLVNVFVAVHIVILAWLAVAGGITVAQFAGFVSLLSSLGAPSISLGSFYRVAVTCAGSVQRVDEFLDQAKGKSVEKLVEALLKVEDSSSDCFDRQISPMQFGDLDVQDLSFQYPGAQDLAIRDVSLQIPSGKFIALVGESGCGKTTLLSLLMTWLRPSQGSISLGTAIRFDPAQGDADDAARRLRKSTSVVFQNGQLLRGSVLENIMISAPAGTTQKDVEWAAAAAGCAEFITTQLPHGYETMLGGADGVSLSGGQAQRICIARALCRKPAVLLLDEATSALDLETEHHILQTIAGLRTSHPEEFSKLVIVFVTHHLYTLKYCDMVVHLKPGGTIDRVEHQST
eukprot:TRINITY_DN37250_c0_g1_i1.p1 TRINITY_DN37250_c0_g1~~TRINITY_DN37250_c0_g1_i1.p1  ORF type:complete len:857 (+),score=157.74 TRINITY_DN37250_c0_g1_i1:101-2671(+)